VPDIIGWDIGGVHLKAARLIFSGGRLAEARTALRYFEMWRERPRLPEALRALRRELGGEAATHAVTMTGELADCFASRAGGVRAILEAARVGLGEERLRVWSIGGTFADPRAAQERPLLFAASNWLATAEVAARCAGEGLLVDIGSTTSDLVPLAAGRAAPVARDDTGRLMSGELVYAGILRTPPAALAPEVPLRGGWCRLSPEPFAFSADIYLALGRIAPSQVTGPTADGRPANPEAALARLARLVCADLSDLGREAVMEMARFVESAQVSLFERAARQALAHGGGRSHLDAGAAGRVSWAVAMVGAPPASAEPGLAGVGGLERGTVVATGLGSFLAARLAQRLDLPCRNLSDLIPLDEPQAAPATCVALLLAEESLGIRGPEAWRARA
jgi:probable H4MPT-linked C1 transfer pathway protein